MKQLITKYVNINEIDCMSLKELKSFIDNSIDKYGDSAKVDLDVTEEYNSTYASVTLKYSAYETDEEEQTRIDRSMKMQKIIEERERAEFTRLQAKYK